MKKGEIPASLRPRSIVDHPGISIFLYRQGNGKNQKQSIDPGGAGAFALRIENTETGETAVSRPFSIFTKGIVLAQPSGDIYYRGNFLPVRWEIIGEQLTDIPIYFHLINTRAGFHHRFTGAIPANRRSRLFFLAPETIPPGSGYQVWITVSPSASSEALSVSESFSIQNPTLQLTRPRENGTTFRKGDHMTISWRAGHFPEGTTVKGTLAVVTPGGITDLICDTVDLNRGTYRWTVGRWGCGPVGPELRSTATPILEA